MENKVSSLKTRSIKINTAYEIVMVMLALTVLILLALEHLVPLTEEQ